VHRVIGRLQSNANAPYDAGPAPVSALAVAPIGKNVPLDEFAPRLEKALAAQDSTLRLTSASCDQGLWPGAAQTPWHHDQNPEVVAWLTQQEERWPFIIYETDPTWSAWTNRCLRQADRILLVANAEDDPARSGLEEGWELERTRKPGAVTDLVLLHRTKRGPTTGTRRWLEAREVAAHYHVWMGSQEDIERVVRRVTGRANSLVLGGGGARCFAQIGAIRALDEAKVPIDMIGGASMGAFIGAQRAMGFDAAAIHKHTKDYWVHGKWADYTIPYLALLNGRKFKKLIKQLYGDAQIEDLPTEFFCVSTNVTRAEVMVHRQGPLWRWLCASIAVPGVAPPLFDEGCLLVDGAVLNNLPIDVMRGLCAGQIIAVDVSPFQDLKIDPDYNEPPTAGRILWSRVSPFAERLSLPSLGEILSRVSSLPSVQAVETLKRQASLYLHPPVDAFSIIDFKRIDELVEIGYRDTLKTLEEWQKTRG
jgi:NTE family protein/lysophospholipid hydrolase